MCFNGYQLIGISDITKFNLQQIQMLLKAFLCPLGAHNIFKSVIPLYRVFPAYNLSTISSTDIPIEKILKATSNRKFDTVQDAMFCSVIIQMISNNKTLNKRDLNSIEKEVQRMISQSLRYMHELSVTEALLLSNRLLNLLSSKNLKINHELKMSFLKKINNNIEISLNKNCENAYFNKALDYVKFLVNSKAPRAIITDLLIYMEEKASSDQQILDIVNVYLSLKSRNIFFWFQTIQIFIEKRIGSRIYELPLSSPLIDESILKLFLNFKLHLKWPFNCFPVWVFKLMEKLKQKHLNNKFEIASSKRINFLSTYVMVVKSAQIYTQCYFVKTQNFVFIVEYFLKICELFDGSQMETMDQKIQPFFDLFFALYLFFKHHSLVDNEAILFGMDQCMCNIFDHYYSQMPAMISKQSGKNKQKLINSLISYCLRYQNLLQIYQNRNIRCATYLPRIFNKLKQIFVREFLHQKSDGKSYSHYKLLPILTRFSKEFEKVNILTGKYEMHKILQKCQNYLQNLSVLEMQKIYSAKEIVDVISFVRISMLSVQFPISHKFATIYQQHQSNNFSLVTEAFFQTNFKCNQLLSQQMLRLNRVLVGKFGKHLSQQNGSQRFIADLSSVHYKYQNMEEQLASNLIYMFKVRPLLIKSVDSKLYNFWFIQHPDIIIKTFSAAPPKNISYWLILISNIKYLRLITRQCAIDFMAQVMRICHASIQKIEDVFISIFTDKVIYSSLFEKVDQIAQFKYMWLVMLFNKIYLNSCLKNKQPNNQDIMIFRHESSNDKVSFHNSVQLMAIFSHDIKSPLEVGSFKSQLTCRAVTQIIHNTYQIFESNFNKRPEDLSIVRRERQKILSMLPIEQLIYLLTEHNFGQSAQWISYVNGTMFLGYIEYKYTTLQQYNLLLCLDKKNPQTKRAINSLISRQMQLFGYSDQNIDDNRLYESTVLKFYFYLLQPNSTQHYLRQSLEILDNQNAIKDSQIIDYWISKAIVINTVNDKLISCMLKRLFLIPTELTYLQFTTIVNTLIALFKKGRLLIYNQKNSVQWKQLRSWIERNMLELVEPNPKRYLLDYFTLIFHQLINPIGSIEDQMEQLISFQMNQDNIEIIHHLYTNKHYLSEKNFQDLRHMLQRCRNRALLLSYYNLPQNCYFRVGFFLVRLWAIAIRNDANHNSIEWFIHHIFTAFDTTGIIEFFSGQGNRKVVHSIIKRYRISERKLYSQVENKLFKIIRKFVQIEQSQLQIEMTEKQKMLSKDQMDKNWEEVKITQKGLQMHKNGDNIMYFLEGSQVSAEQQIQMDYLKLLLGPQISVSIRKCHQTIKN